MGILRLRARGGACKGFSLLEVILSIVILSVGIVSVQRVFVRSLSGLGVVESWSQAERLLDGKIWELGRDVREQGKRFQSHNDSQVLLGSDRTFQYDVTIQDIGPDARLMEAQAAISWGNRGPGQHIKRTFYLMVPYADWKG